MKRKAFTLTELMAVMFILVLLAGMTMPLYRTMTGSRSVAIAENKISSMLARARTSATGNGRIEGVFFFQNPTGDGYEMALVYATAPQLPPQNPYGNGSDSPYARYLDLDPSSGFEPLPSQIQVDGIINGLQGAIGFNNGVPFRNRDSYAGYNTYGLAWSNGNLAAATRTAIRFGPVILFDAAGRVTCQPYSFRCSTLANKATAMGTLLYGAASTPLDLLVCPNGEAYNRPNGGPQAQTMLWPGNGASWSAPPIQSQLGVAIFDDSAFRDHGFVLGNPSLDPTINNGNYWNGTMDQYLYGPEYGEQGARAGAELWIDQQAIYGIGKAGSLVRMH